jgi:hypothetical protein
LPVALKKHCASQAIQKFLEGFREPYLFQSIIHLKDGQTANRYR